MEMDTALAVAEAEQGGTDDMELVALTPSDLLAAQTNLVTWCDRKIKSIRTELSDLRENLRIAKESKWRTSGLSAAINRAEKRIHFYDKINAAVAAGYLIVPNFPIDVFAVRVKRAKPTETVRDSVWSRHEAAAELLPVGHGRYVDNETIQRDESVTETLPTGGKKTTTRLIDTDFEDEIGFPVQAVKPVIMDATQRAMALRIFDQIGLVQNGRKRGDPIIVGRLLDPRGSERMVTFFVAWWLNTNTL